MLGGGDLSLLFIGAVPRSHMALFAKRRVLVLMGYCFGVGEVQALSNQILDLFKNTSKHPQETLDGLCVTAVEDRLTKFASMANESARIKVVHGVKIQISDQHIRAHLALASGHGWQCEAEQVNVHGYGSPQVLHGCPSTPVQRPTASLPHIGPETSTILRDAGLSGATLWTRTVPPEHTLPKVRREAGDTAPCNCEFE